MGPLRGAGLPVATAAEDHRGDAFAVRALGDEADQDPVIAGLDRVAEGTDRVGHAVIVENRPADGAFRPAPVDGVELVRDLGRHAPGELLAANGKNVGGEAAGVLHGGQSVRTVSY